MKDRAILFTALVLLLTVALFAWLSWARWGMIGIHPLLGFLVLGAALIALAATGALLFSRRRAARAQSRLPLAASRPVPLETCQEGKDKTKVTTVEIS